MKVRFIFAFSLFYRLSTPNPHACFHPCVSRSRTPPPYNVHTCLHRAHQPKASCSRFKEPCATTHPPSLSGSSITTKPVHGTLSCTPRQPYAKWTAHLRASPAVRLTPGFLSPRNTAATASSPAGPAASPAPPIYATAARRAATGNARQEKTNDTASASGVCECGCSLGGSATTNTGAAGEKPR